MYVIGVLEFYHLHKIAKDKLLLRNVSFKLCAVDLSSYSYTRPISHRHHLSSFHLRQGLNPNHDSFLLLEEAYATSPAFRFELRSGLDMAALVI